MHPNAIVPSPPFRIDDEVFARALDAVLEADDAEGTKLRAFLQLCALEGIRPRSPDPMPCPCRGRCACHKEFSK